LESIGFNIIWKRIVLDIVEWDKCILEFIIMVWHSWWYMLEDDNIDWL